jgi:hypothetical protein
MSPSDKIAALWQWGHFRNPDLPDTRNVQESDLTSLTLNDRVVRQAIASWQAFDAQFEPLSQAAHARSIHPDGDVGPVTELMFDTPRCACPDYSEGLHAWDAGEIAEATGRGHWAKCHGASDHHKAVGRCTGTLTSQLAAAYQGGRVVDAVLNLVRRGYGEIGLEWVWDWKGSIPKYQTEVRFGRWSGSWIGLAQVPQPGLSCSASPLWAQHQTSFRSGEGASTVLTWWPILMMHELGHNCSAGHTRGGIMNPSILAVPPRWVGDTSEQLFRGLFGGKPVPGWPNFDGGDTPPTGDSTVWNWTQPLEFSDGKVRSYQMQMTGPMMIGAGYGSFSGNWGKAGPPIRMQCLFQPRMGEASSGEPLEAAV